MNRSVCKRWAQLVDREALGEALSDDEHRFVHRHRTQCVACAAEASVWEELGGMLRKDVTDAPVFPGSSDFSGAPQQAPAVSSVRSSLTWPRVGAGAAAVVVAAGVALWAGGFQVTGSKVAEQVAPSAEASVSVSSISGTATIEGTAVVAGMVIHSEQVIEVERGRLCLNYSPGVSACAAPGSVLRSVTTGQHGPRLVLERGAVVCQLDARPVGGEFSVVTGRGQVTAKGTVFAVELGDDNSELAVRLHRGVVEVESPSGERRELHAPAALVIESGFHGAPSAGVEWQTDLRLLAGEEPLAYSDSVSPGVQGVDAGAYEALLEATSEPDAPSRATVPGQSKPRAARASAEELLTQAGKLRTAGRFVEAGAAYQKLVRQHPSSAAGRAALMSLAELQLSRLGQPASALRSFDAYLAKGGPLAQEARYGRIRALRRLGRTAEARAATEAFVRDFPGSPQAEAIRGTSRER